MHDSFLKKQRICLQGRKDWWNVTDDINVVSSSLKPSFSNQGRRGDRGGYNMTGGNIASEVELHSVAHSRARQAVLETSLSAIRV